MKPFRLNIQQGLFGLAFLIALAVRLLQLGQSTLSDSEAVWALQALDLALGHHPLVGPQPGLVVWDGGLFYLFGSSALAARLLPALIGALLVFGPLFFSRRLGKAASVVAGFALALDPGLVAVSRQVDGRMIALTFSILALGFWEVKKPAWAGICLGLAVLGGPSFWLGGLILGASWAIALILRARSPVVPDLVVPELVETTPVPAERKNDLLALLPWTVGAAVLGGSLFLLAPQGLSAIPASLVAFLQGLSSGAALNLILLALPIYAPLGLLLAILATINNLLTHQETDRTLAAWFWAGLLIVILYQAHQVADLVWVVVPMWVLAAREAVQIVEQVYNRRLVGLFGTIIFVLLAYAWLNFIALQTSIPTSDDNVRWAAILGVVFLLLVAMVLVTWGWNLASAIQSFIFGLCVILLLGTLANTTRSAGWGPRPDQELWQEGKSLAEADLLEKSVGDLSEWKTGRRDWLDIQVAGVNLPSLQWLLRDQVHISYPEVLAPDATPSLVITPDQPKLPLNATYSGQDFVSQASPAWDKLSTLEWLHWMIYRESPALDQPSIVLWVRSDVFPGAAGITPNKP